MFTLYVGDLDEQIDEYLLIHYFQKFGSIIDVKISRNYETKRSKGFGFVSYGSQLEGN